MWDPVVEMRQALYGHPDAGGYWERHCERGVLKAGFKPMGDCAEWRSCYFNSKTGVLCVIYVDDFKLAGPEHEVAQAWKDISDIGGIKITEPERSTNFLGCKHHVERNVNANGVSVSKITYDMEDFLRECCSTYEDLATTQGQKVTWTPVDTPFIEETDWDDTSKRPVTEDEDGYKCSFCQGIFPKSTLETVRQGTANKRPRRSGGPVPRSDGGAEGHNHALEAMLTQPAPGPPEGKLKPIAAKVLMKVFYAARLARFDLLRAVANLSRYVTKWTREHDKRLMKLMQYIKCTLDYRQVGWIGDDITKLILHLYADTNFGGSQGKSTTGVQLNIEGPNTFFPMEGISIAQTVVAHSTPESEIMAAWTALRKTVFLH